MGIVVKRSLAERSRKIALKRGIPIVTVETILKDYLHDLTEAALNGERIVIDGITSISIFYDLDRGEFYPRGRVSESLRSRLLAKRAEEESGVESGVEGVK